MPEISSGRFQFAKICGSGGMRILVLSEESRLRTRNLPTSRELRTDGSAVWFQIAASGLGESGAGALKTQSFCVESNAALRRVMSQSEVRCGMSQATMKFQGCGEWDKAVSMAAIGPQFSRRSGRIGYPKDSYRCGGAMMWKLTETDFSISAKCTSKGFPLKGISALSRPMRELAPPASKKAPTGGGTADCEA